MSAYWSQVETPKAYVKPVKRPRGPQALTFLFTFLQPATFAFLSAIPEQPLHAATRKHPPCPLPTSQLSSTRTASPEQLENIFFDALAQACVCRHHSRVSPDRMLISKLSYLHHKPRRKYHYNLRQVRHFHRKATATRPPSSRLPLSREEYMSMLDWYREPFSTQAAYNESNPFRPPVPSDWEPPWCSTSSSIASHPSPGTTTGSGGLSLSSPTSSPPLSQPSGLSNQIEPPRSCESSPLTVEPSNVSCGLKDINGDQNATGNLYETIKGDDCTHEAAFVAYSALPSPGVSHLGNDGIRLLFRRLSAIQTKNADSMLRYLSVVDDMKSTGLVMTEAEWNSAIAFCAQCLAHIQSEDVESALRTWKYMEEKAAVKSGNVTFNILFDIAAKAGKYVLAEMILKEMESRKLSFNRYGRVSLIYYHGLKADGDGVRRTYRELVEANEIVDTVVMNCVIVSLIRAGEPAAAERIYERMKAVVAEHTDRRVPKSFCWKEERDLGRLLDKAARNLKYQPGKLQQLREEQLPAPNLSTYAIFVEHHATETGELRRIIALLTEMQYFGVPMHGRIFLKIFKGFAFHGGQRYTTWTKDRLESVWNSLLTALDQDADVKVVKWVVIWAVRAFERCAGRERTLEPTKKRQRANSKEESSRVPSKTELKKTIKTSDTGTLRELLLLAASSSNAIAKEISSRRDAILKAESERESSASIISAKGPGTNCNKASVAEEIIAEIRKQTPAHSSFGIKKSALETLRKIGKSIVLRIGDTFGSEVVKSLSQAGDPQEKVMLDIVNEVGEEEKTRMADNKEWIEKVEELTVLGANRDIYQSLEEMLEVLGWTEVRDDEVDEVDER